MITVRFTQPGPSVTQSAKSGDRVSFSGDAGVVLRRVSGAPVSSGDFIHEGADDSYFMECVSIGAAGVEVGRFSVASPEVV